jgi:hypothetical protein
MMAHRTITPRVFVAIALAVVLCSGCSSQSVGDRLVADANKTNIQRLANLYSAYQALHGWKGPKDETEFKAFIGKADAGMLKTMNVDTANIDKLFMNERDSKPFKIRYGVSGGMGAIIPVIFEEGSGTGSRQVAFTGMKLETVDEAKYDQLWKGIVVTDSPGISNNPNAPVAPGGPPAGAITRPSGPPNVPPKK